METYLSVLQSFILSLFACPHHRAHPVEGKTYCPDCGQGIIFRWIVLKCLGCGQRRPGRYTLRRIMPQTPCCTFCGERQVETQILSEPAFYQIRLALLIPETPKSLSNTGYRATASMWVGEIKASLGSFRKLSTCYSFPAPLSR